MKEEQKQHLIDMMQEDERLGLYEYIGVCEGNNGDGCFMDSSGHDCGCYTRVVKQEIKLDDIFNDEKRQGVKELIDTHKQTLEEVFGSSMCQFSVIENKLATLYRNQVKIYDAIIKEQQSYTEEDMEAAFYSDAKEWMSFKEWVKQY
jgi:hypothetical protein